MNIDCYIVIAIICLFQVLDIMQLKEIKDMIEGKFFDDFNKNNK